MLLCSTDYSIDPLEVKAKTEKFYSSRKPKIKTLKRRVKDDPK